MDNLKQCLHNIYGYIPSEEEVKAIIKAHKLDNKQRRKEKKPNPEFAECVKIWNEFFKSKTTLPIKFDGSEGQAMKTIISYLTAATREKGSNATDGWKFILNSFDKWQPFHKQQLTLKQINSNLANILNTIRNGYNGKQAITEIGINEALRTRLEEIRAEKQNP